MWVCLHTIWISFTTRCGLTFFLKKEKILYFQWDLAKSEGLDFILWFHFSFLEHKCYSVIRETFFSLSATVQLYGTPIQVPCKCQVRKTVQFSVLLGINFLSILNYLTYLSICFNTTSTLNPFKQSTNQKFVHIFN